VTPAANRMVDYWKGHLELHEGGMSVREMVSVFGGSHMSVYRTLKEAELLREFGALPGVEPSGTNCKRKAHRQAAARLGLLPEDVTPRDARERGKGQAAEHGVTPCDKCLGRGWL
jgi:hypothetical protein